MALSMSRLILSLSFFLLSFGLYAQDQTDQHFVYIQTENNQPFYIRMDGKVFSSTSGGYVILSKLASGNYKLFAGFPKNEFPEQEFHITLSGINEGFLLKKLGSGWALFNIETMALTEGVNTIPVQTETKSKTPIVDNDPFATLLAGAVQDSSILENDVTTKLPEKKPDTVQTATTAVIEPMPDTMATIISNVDTSNNVAVTIPEVPANTIKNSSPDSTISSAPATHIDMSVAPVTKQTTSKEKTVRRILLVNETGGLELVYVDNPLKDTVRIFMPVMASGKKEKPTAKVIYNPPVSDTVALTITPTIISDSTIPEKQKIEKPAENKPETKGQIIYNPEPDTTDVNDNSDVGEVSNDKNQNTPRIVYDSSANSDCHNFATKKDFLRLRKKMAAETDNDKMIGVARKYFRNTCFSTEQIRNLSYLFLNDEGRYQFFDAAYPYTSDSGQYSSLESQLTDPYYINRFRAMIHK